MGNNIKFPKNIYYNYLLLKYMGAFLDTPIKDKNPEHGNNDMCWWAACSMQGWRTG